MSKFFFNLLLFGGFPMLLSAQTLDLSVEPLPNEVTERDQLLKCHIKSATQPTLEVWVNEQKWIAMVKQLSFMQPNAYEMTATIQLPPTHTLIEIRVVVHNATETQGFMLSTQYMPSRSIYGLSVGVPSNLQFTKKDGFDFKNLLDNVHGFKDVVMELDTVARYTDILAGFDKLRRHFLSGHVKPTDVIVLYLSGHGKSTNQGFFYFLPTDAKPGLEEKTTISAATIQEYFDTVKCRKILFLDACASGTVGAKLDETEIDNAQQLERMKDWVIFTSSSTESSYEHPELKNSLFMSVLASAVQSNADVNQDNWLSINELHNHLQKKVPPLQKKFYPMALPQIPQLKNECLSNDTPLFKLNKK
jgi:hypothetical protein